MMRKNFKILNVDHIAFATSNIEKSKKIFSDVLGLKYESLENVKSEKVKVLKLLTNKGSTVIELLQPKHDNEVINKFIKKRGNGLHHIALEVDSLENLIIYLNSLDISLIYQKPKLGSNNKLITFIHPKYSTGMLIELCQKQ